MADVIDSLLIRLGLETDDKDFKEAGALFDGVRTRALQFGAAIGAGLGVNNLTFGFAQAKAELGAFADVYGTTAQFVDSLGYAFDQVDGDASEAFGSIKRIRDLIESTEWGKIGNDAFRVAGFDPYMLRGVTDVADAYERIASAVRGLSPEDARRALSSLGFGESEIRLFRRGPDGFRQLIADGESYAQVTREMTEQAARFQTSLTNLTKSVDGLGNSISTLLLDDFSDAMQTMADYIRDNREPIAGFFEKALPWLEATAIGIGTLVALQGGKALVGKLGLVGKVGPALAIGLGYQYLRENPDHIEKSINAAQSAWDNQFNRDQYFSGVAEIADSDIPTMRDIPGASTTINIDARGSTDPAEVEAAARRGTEAALGRMSRETRIDLSTSVK